MAYVITDACIARGVCRPECPVDCVAEGAIYEVDENACIDCGSCAGAYSTGAVQLE